MNDIQKNKREFITLILRFNLIIGIYNLYLFSISDSLFNLIIGSMNIGVLTFFRNMSIIALKNKIKR